MIASYDYDANGNRTTQDLVGTAPVTADYDDHDRLLRHGSTTYRYTANGELRERTTATAESTLYSYDAAGSLTGVELADGRTISYVTDGLGRRIATQDQRRPTARLRLRRGRSAISRNRCQWADPLAALCTPPDRTFPSTCSSAGRTYRLIADQLGSVRLVIDTQTGDIAQRIDYDPYGAISTDTNPGFQPFAYAGGLYDTDTGLIRFGARDYDPQTGR